MVVVDSESVEEEDWFDGDLDFLLFLPLEEPPALAKDTIRNKRTESKMRMNENFSAHPGRWI